MTTYGADEYRRNMAAIHARVVATDEEVVVTRHGRPHVKVVPATREAMFDRLHAQGRVSLPSTRRRPIVPVDAGGHDSTLALARERR